MGNKGVLVFGIILLLVGIGLIFSSLDMSNLRPIDLTFQSPAGDVTIDSFTEDEEQRIIVGIIIAGIGIALIKFGK
ncbi:hypothetical protein [Nitrosopumilus sp.]|uniref:hypothetical protein n=1 Tax=Nitrosopumilus sp. TaxID=2024843 RepID=UPI00247F032D|nr:hypothetical protein [Nitrosopumilus sp.]MCV0431478.1 hypothetical protein [Nitrosopumilus sp.]